MILQKNSNPDINLNSRLSVQLSLTGLSFLITSTISKKVLYFSEKKFDHNITPEELLFELKTIIEQQEELQKKFDEITIVYATTLYALVPTPLFDETKASDYLKLNSKILANDFVAFDTLENSDITIVYIPYININNYLFEKFGDFKYYHSATLLLKFILNIEKHSSQPKVYINVVKDIFDIIVIKNGELLLCNTYDFKTPEDFIYYILFCLEQLKMNPDIIEFVLSGTIDKEDATYIILYKYIRNVSFIIPEESHIYIDEDTNSIHQNLLLMLIK